MRWRNIFNEVWLRNCPFLKTDHFFENQLLECVCREVIYLNLKRGKSYCLQFKTNKLIRKKISIIPQSWKVFLPRFHHLAHNTRLCRGGLGPALLPCGPWGWRRAACLGCPAGCDVRDGIPIQPFTNCLRHILLPSGYTLLQATVGLAGRFKM